MLTRERRPWTRLGTLGVAAHVFYELAAGVGMPFASRVGPVAAAGLWASGATVAFREAGRQPSSRDPAFAVLNGVFLSAVVAHFAAWPRTSRAGLPWLTECEGLRGEVMPAYNSILYLSGIAALASLLTENRRGSAWGALVPLALVPAMMAEQHREHGRLLERAGRDRRWWNRRLAD